MKKIIALLIAAVLVLTLAGCAKKTDTAETAATEAPKTEKAKFVNMVTGGTAGTYYALGADLCNMLTKTVGSIDVSPSVGNGSASNIREISAGNADLAFSQADVAIYAWKGIETFANEQTQSFGVIGVLYPEVVQAAYCDETGIETVKDFAGRSISIGAAGSGVYQSVVDVLTVSDMKLEDITPNYLSFAESADAIKNNQIDAAFITAGIPNSAIQDLASVRDIELLNLDDAAVEKLCAEKPYTPYTIAAGTYQGQSRDAKTVAINSVLLASREMSEDDVYAITKAIYENTSELTHASAAFIKIETALDGIDTEMLHPGALKYYQEKGLIK
ncbi:MAG: TAXI family TRAP transporter solute-binding subunit [Clostridia bacterium]|nr:TAXI family TRAP transporter solute-binding subunit [Clostridia bacterium]